MSPRRSTVPRAFRNAEAVAVMALEAAVLAICAG